MSARFSVYYARRTESKPDLEYIKENKLDFVLEAPEGKFVLLKSEEGSPNIERNSCQHYSRVIGEAIYMGIQENVNSFHYEHWKEGVQIRLLSYNSDYSWHTVAGEPEEWEKEVLFTDERLKEVLGCYEEEFHGEIRQAWEKKHIRQGDQFPSIIETEAYGGLSRLLQKSAPLLGQADTSF